MVKKLSVRLRRRNQRKRLDPIKKFMAAAALFAGAGLASIGAAAQDLPPTQSTQALVQAAQAGDLHRVTDLLQAGADPNVVDPQWNAPLSFAARGGRLAMVRLLIRAGAVIDWQDGDKVTPLALAAHFNHRPVVEYLLARGANPFIVDRWRRRALDYALRRGAHDPIAAILHRAEVNWPKNPDGTPVKKRK